MSINFMQQKSYLIVGIVLVVFFIVSLLFKRKIFNFSKILAKKNMRYLEVLFSGLSKYLFAYILFIVIFGGVEFLDVGADIKKLIIQIPVIDEQKKIISDQVKRISEFESKNQSLNQKTTGNKN